MAIHGTEQRLVLCYVFLKGETIVLVGLFEAWLAARPRHTSNVDTQSSAFLLLQFRAGTAVGLRTTQHVRAACERAYLGRQLALHGWLICALKLCFFISIWFRVELEA